MGIEIAPAQPILVEYRCEECGEGYYKSTDIQLLSDPPKYPHRCINCGDTKTFDRAYPFVQFQPAGPLIPADGVEQRPKGVSWH